MWDLVCQPGMNLDSLHWECGVLAIGPPGKSHFLCISQSPNIVFLSLLFPPDSTQASFPIPSSEVFLETSCFPWLILALILLSTSDELNFIFQMEKMQRRLFSRCEGDYFNTKPQWPSHLFQQKCETPQTAFCDLDLTYTPNLVFNNLPPICSQFHNLSPCCKAGMFMNKAFSRRLPPSLPTLLENFKLSVNSKFVYLLVSDVSLLIKFRHCLFFFFFNNSLSFLYLKFIFSVNTHWVPIKCRAICSMQLLQWVLRYMSS